MFQLQQQAPEILLDVRFLGVQLTGRGPDEGLARLRLAQVERVEMQQFVAAGQDVDSQLLRAAVAVQSPHAIVAGVDGEVQVVPFHFQMDVFLRGAHAGADFLRGMS